MVKTKKEPNPKNKNQKRQKIKTTTKAMLVMTTMLTSIAGNLPTTADIKVPIKICKSEFLISNNLLQVHHDG